MKTITIDDRISVVNIILRLLKKIDGDGVHIGTTKPQEVISALQAERYDVAFLDIEMPGMNGLQLAQKLQAIDPQLNIIFITAYDEYMSEAFDMYASAYLLKPISEESMRKALDHLRYQIRNEEKRLRVQCFGSFEVFADNVPVDFHRKKSKEMFAYLIDRRGAVCSYDMIIGNLWGDKSLTDSLKSMERTVQAIMIKDLERYGFRDVIIRNRNGIAVNMERISCDYYDYLQYGKQSRYQFNGEYMTQYEFASETRDNLLRDYL